RVGDRVKAGSLLAYLDTKGQLEAAVEQAEARVEVARSRLAQVRAGSKSSEVAAQRAEIERLEIEWANAVDDYQRYQKLHQKDVVAEMAVQPRKAAAEAAKRSLEEARQRLNGLSEVRSVDVDLAERELQSSLADLKRARADATAAVIRSPVDG